MQLYNTFISSASYRVRIALNLKGVAYEYVSVNPLKGDNLKPEYLSVNPQGLIPTLVDGQNTLTQSLAIMEYLEETHPEPPLLPADPVGRARVRALSLVPACEMHPVYTPRVRQYLANELGLDQETSIAFGGHWIGLGFGTLESQLKDSPHTGMFCHGDRPTLADVCLVPQLFIARVVQADVSPYPTLLRIEEACLALPEFKAAHPDNQPDAPADD
ncbi:MAG: maleylacetoacetate isomerase [Alphaproteobacteria bacterium]|nr:maleylacetoacetate isomerase [Alphaproteobacteria bacterium]